MLPIKEQTTPLLLNLEVLLDTTILGGIAVAKETVIMAVLEAFLYLLEVRFVLFFYILSYLKQHRWCNG